MSNSSVLIVEDEPLISMMLENFLEALDRDVAGTAESVDSALLLIRERRCDAVILDLNLLGGETSEPVAEELVRLGIPFILASGGGKNEDAEIFRGRPRLAKPFTLADMERVLLEI